MKKSLAIFLVLSGLTLQMSGCATHYILGTCPVTGDPPVMPKIEWTRTCIAGNDPDKVICTRAPKDEANLNKLRVWIKMMQIYMNDCYEKIGEKSK